MKRIKKFLYVAFGLGMMASAAGAWAQATSTTATTTINYPSFVNSTTPGGFVGSTYTYALGLAGTLAVIMIVYGGVKYVASAGNTSQQADARDIIQNAVLGILLLGGAYLILNTINPEITKLKSPSLKKITTTNTPYSEEQNPGSILHNTTPPKPEDSSVCNPGSLLYNKAQCDALKNPTTPPEQP